jgi:ferric-dicitrate binding protein FerR (iron transport regulator)
MYKSPNNDWQKASADTVLEQGYSLQVVGAGRSILNLDDGSSVRLNENTKITLTSLNPEHIIITNDKGEVYSRVMKAER